MQYSHSRVELFNKCKYKYKLQYIDKLKALPSDDPQNALNLGLMVHTAIEKGLKKAVREYYSKYPIIDDLHINEVIKIEYLLPKILNLLPQNCEHEIKIENENFIGYVDLIAKNENGTYNLYDFKYSNNIENYNESPQLSLYKYFLEKDRKIKIENMYFLFVPKTAIRLKKTENLKEFRQRIIETLETLKIKIVKIDYNTEHIIDFLINVKKINECEDFEQKNKTRLCDWCDYQKFCEENIDYMIKLPENKRREKTSLNKKTIWIYGSPFVGKTTFANKFPDPLMLNTDGNITFVDAPYIHIKDTVEMNGRIEKRTYAWENFKEIIKQLELKDNDFKTIIVDLVEDLYEHCRLYVFKKNNIEHESDSGFGKGWDLVKTEFLTEMKKLLNLNYKNIILISHEDTSKDITKRSGDKITSVKPNINEKTANKLAGMVDIVGRIISEDDNRKLLLNTNEYTFSGGRINTKLKHIQLEYSEFINLYEDITIENNKINVSEENKENEPEETTTENNIVQEEKQEKIPTKTRKRRTE